MTATKKPASLRLLPSKNSALATSLMCAAAFAAPAHAEEAKQTLAPVVVEGTSIGDANPYADPAAPYKADYSASGKFTERLLDTPRTVNVITKEYIQDQGFTSFVDVVRTQPGVTLNTGEGGNAFGDRVVIRGFSAQNDIYIDGVRDPGVSSRETFAVEQVELVKGAGSTYGGRGTTGGSVNLVTKQAVEGAQFNNLEVGIGTDHRKRVTFDSNYAVTDRWAVRFNGLMHDSEVAGRDEGEDTRYGAALATTIRPVDALKLDFDYYHLTTNSLPDWGMPFDPTTNQPVKIDRGNFYGLVDRDFHDTTANIATAKAEYDFGNGQKLGTTFRYGVTTNDYIATAPEGIDLVAGTVRGASKRRGQQNEYFTNQTNLTSEFDTGSLGHTLVSGFEISREMSSNNADVVDPSSVTQDLYNPDPYNWTGTVTGANTPGAKSTIDNIGLFVSDTVKLNEQWQVLGGLRYDDYTVSSYRPAGRSAEFRGENKSDFWNWHAGVVYKPLPNGSIYATYSTSSDPSGAGLDASGDTDGGLTADNVNLDPERNRSYELGTKWELFDNRLSLNTSVFQTLKSNARINDTTGAVLTMAGEQRVRGVEVSAAGNVTDAWSMSGGIVYLDGEVTESPNAAQVGADIPNISDWSFSLFNRYQLTDKLALGGLAYYASTKHGGAFAATEAKVPAYWRFDAMAQYQVNEQVDLRLNVQNLFDQEYYDSIYRNSIPFAYIAPGRVAYLTVGYKF